MMKLPCVFAFVYLWLPSVASASHIRSNPNSVFIVGSINADVTFPLEKLPQVGETAVSNTTDYHTVAGGKGANQAVSCSRHGCPTYFTCNFGNDANAEMLEKVLQDNQVNLQYCHRSNKPSGLGLVFLQSTGAVSAIVIGGANAAWPIPDANNILKNLHNNNDKDSKSNSNSNKVACIMLQMEIPQHINQLYAEAAHKLGIPIFQDVGGEERDMPDEYLSLLTYLSPNLTELQRLAKMPVSNEEEIIVAAKSLQQRGAKNVLVTLGANGSLLVTQQGDIIKQNCHPVDEVVDETGAGDNYRAGFVVSHFVDKKSLQESMSYAAAAGAVAVTKAGAIPSCSSRDECEALLRKQNAGGDAFLNLNGGAALSNGKSSSNISVRSTSDGKSIINVDDSNNNDDDDDSYPLECPWKFASRLNSMKDRWDLMIPPPSSSSSPLSSSPSPSNVLSWIERQGRIKALDLIDFNYPQHLTSPPRITTTTSTSAVTDVAGSGSYTDEYKLITVAMKNANLKCGAICLRFPKEMQLGAYTHPQQAMRNKAIQLTKDACEWALALGTNEVVVWSAYCGYDYSFQVDYNTIYQQVVEAFQQVCDAYPTVKVSLEYKPTDENTRFFAIPSTAAAILLTQDVDRQNFGLTLDFGHCLMAGENPAQSVATVVRHTSSGSSGSGDDAIGKNTKVGSSKDCREENNSNRHSNKSSISPKSSNNRYINKLFGVQLGDGYGRLGAEDGLAFGSLHPIAALEFIYYLIITNYQGHIYFDTFPRNEDPVREFEYNMRVVKRMYQKVVQQLLLKKADKLSGKKKNLLKEYMKNHDAMSVLELLEGIEEKEGDN